MPSDSTESLAPIHEIVDHLLFGKNVILYGPNRDLIDRVMTASRVELEKYVRTHLIESDLIREEIGRVASSGVNYIVAQGLSPEQVFQILTEHSNLILLTAIPNAHAFGVSFVWAKELQREFGDNSSVIKPMLENALKMLRYVGVSLLSEPKGTGGTFREKLLAARYNQKSAGTDHGALLKGWTQEGDACDPGWELDRSERL